MWLGVFVCQECADKLTLAAGGNSSCLIKKVYGEHWDPYQLKSLANGGNEKFFHYLRYYGVENKSLPENYNKDIVRWYRASHEAKMDGVVLKVRQPPKDIGGKINQTSTKIVKGAATGAVTGVKGVGKGGMFLLKKIKSGGAAVGKGAKMVGGKVASGGKTVVTSAPGTIKMAAKGVANKSVGAAKFVGAGAVNMKQAVKQKIASKKQGNEWTGYMNIDADVLLQANHTELNSESQRFIIDVARTSASPAEVLAALNQSVRIKVYDQYVSPEWQQGLNFQDENSEIILTLVDVLVTNHTADPDCDVRTLSVQKMVPHDKLVGYNANSFAASVNKILTTLGGDDAAKQLETLQAMAKESAQSQKANYADLEYSFNLHSYCLAIILYLGHFERKPS